MTSLAAMLCSTVHHHRDRPAVHAEEKTFSYGEFASRVARAAGMLRSLGVLPGQRFGVLSRNGFRTAELLYAGYWSGAIPVPLNIRLALPEMRDILEDAQCRLLFVEDALREALEKPEFAPWRDGAVFITADSEGGPARRYAALLAAAEPAPMHPARGEDEAILLYTGGATGRGKGVRLSHWNVLSNALQVAPALGVRSDDVYLHVAPMFHSADLLGTAWFVYGARHVYLPAFTPGALLETIQRRRATFTMLPPTMLILALQDPGFSSHDLSSLRGLVYGAAPMSEAWVRRAAERLPEVEFYHGYGLTETAPIVSFLSARDYREALQRHEAGALGCCGRPLAGVELRIDEPDPGGAGEAVVRGPNVMIGYWNREEENRQALCDGWFRTGDIGRLDEHGRFYLLDRKKDVVISGGENIYPAEVEAALQTHPGVREAAVIGMPDEVFGEALLAVIVRVSGSDVTEEEIIRHCRGLIGGFKIPRRIRFVEQLPKSALGKVLKGELRQQCANTGS